MSANEMAMQRSRFKVGARKENNETRPFAQVTALARLAPDELLCRLGSSADGLADTEAAARLLRNGPNQVAREQQQSILREFAGRAKNPLNVLLLSLAAVSWMTGRCARGDRNLFDGDPERDPGIPAGAPLNQAAAKLRAMVRTRASVHRARQRAARG